MNTLKTLLLLSFFTTFCAFSQENIKHKVVKGETIYAIAKKYNVEVSKIYELNPKLKTKVLKVNAVVFLPNTTNNDSFKDNQFHKVEKGESFYAISKKYDLTVEALELLNPTIKPNELSVGTLIAISQTNSTTIQEKEEPIVIAKPTEVVKKDTNTNAIHVIQPKETKYGISKKYGISVHELEVLNPNIPSDFPVGYQLVILKNEVVTPTSEDPKVEIIEPVVIATNDFEKTTVLIEKASQYIGTRYKSGGTTSSGFDCSGLMCTTFNEIDLQLPRTSRDQANYGNTVAKNEAQKGDLIFFATGRKNRVSHVGMITEVSDGDIKFIHSSTSSGVMISSLSETYYATRFVKINRVLVN